MLERITAGSTLNFTTSVPDYPADESWVLKFRLVPRSSGDAIELTSSADDADPALHRIQVAAATTAAWSDGTYSWASWVQKAAEVYDLSTGSVRILPDPRTSSAPLDLRSDARKALDDARAARYSWSPTVRSYAIGGRSMTFSSPGEIDVLISQLQVEVNREENAERALKGLKSKRRVYVRVANA